MHDVSFLCKGAGGATKTVASLKGAWDLSAEERDSCDPVLHPDDDFSPVEVKALTIAGFAMNDREELSQLYTICVSYNYRNGPNDDLATTSPEALMALQTLCPEHPERAKLAEASAGQVRASQAESQAKESAAAKALVESTKARALEEKAAVRAYGNSWDEDSVSMLREMCGDEMAGYATDDGRMESELSAEQIKEVEGVLVLCPSHPDANAIKQGLKSSKQTIKEYAEGTRFFSGDYRVNKDIKPGTYVAESDEAFDGCYWSRLNKNGDIIQNYFINSGFRAQVTIRASDYSFSTERCGEWVKQ